MIEANEPNKDKIAEEEPAESIEYDWRNPLKPRNPEDDVIVDGWRRRADGTFEKVKDREAKQ
jgi:hypothetical protein